LNSLNETGPEYITDTYLSLFLTQLQVEGYFIFVVTGILPPCEADELFSLVPYESKPTSSKGMIPSSSKSPRTNFKDDDDDELATAIALSLSETNEPPNEAEQLRQLRLKHFDKNK
jgi:ataxin-3